MHTIIVKPLFHRQAEQIGIVFQKNQQINDVVKKIKEVKWSQTHSCWYVPLSKEAWVGLQNGLKEFMVDSTQLKAYLEKRNIVKASSAGSCDEKKAPLPPQSPVWKLCKENLLALQKFVEQLKLKAYSSSTIRTYRNEFLQLLQLLKNKNVSELVSDDLRRYFIYCLERLQLTENTLHSRINAVKFYFEQVLGREKFFWEIPRPKKAEKLPNVLGEKEIVRLFNSMQNIKHRAILFTAYSAGLRVSETVALKLKDIDSDRMQIKVVAGKGKKDRYVTLSPVLLSFLRTYIKQSITRPAIFLFESEKQGEAYSSRSAQKLFQRAKQKAGIHKDVSFHSLRHSFATHLLEKGVDIRFIKELLGHLSLQTTEKYTHVTRNQIVQIKSPLDDLWLKGDIQ